MGLATLGVMTCCVGMLIMAIPYIGAVVTLPVSSFFRMLGPEFIRQFGKDFDIIVAATPPPVAPS